MNDIKELKNQVLSVLDTLDWRQHFQGINVYTEGVKVVIEFIHSDDRYESLYFDEYGNYAYSINDSLEEVTETDREYQYQILKRIDCLR